MCNREISQRRKSVESGIKTNACLLAAEFVSGNRYFFQYLKVNLHLEFCSVQAGLTMKLKKKTSTLLTFTGFVK